MTNGSATNRKRPANGKGGPNEFKETTNLRKPAEKGIGDGLKKWGRELPEGGREWTKFGIGSSRPHFFNPSYASQSVLVQATVSHSSSP